MKPVWSRIATVLAATALFMAAGIGNQAAFADNITVLVLNETPSGSTPVQGATVTLRGTNPGSLGGLVMVTGASGMVTYNGVTGPYSVTAQKDSVVGGETIRSAGSLVDIAPVLSGSAGTIGVLLELPTDYSPPPFAMLSGTISNLPSLSGSEIIEVVAFERSDEGTIIGSIAIGSSYFLNIPSGAVIDLYIAHRTNFGSSPVLASLIATGLGPVGPGGSLVQNFNFASAVPWSMNVNVSETGRAPGLTHGGIQLEVIDGAGVNMDFSIFDGPTLPSTIKLPNLAGAAFSGFSTPLSVDAYDPSGTFLAQQERVFNLTSTPASVTFDHMPLATAIEPMDGDTFSVAELTGLNVKFIQGSRPPSFVNAGVNGFFLETDPTTGAPPGIDLSTWVVFAAGGNQDFDMPPAALPMFSGGQTVFSGISQQRFKGFAFTLEGFFNANLAANLAAIDQTATEAVSSDVYMTLTIEGGIAYCTAGTSASGCQAMLATTGMPSASAPTGFDVTASGIESNKNGILFFGTSGRQANPWGTGTSYQCVVPPVKRTGLLTWPGANGNCNGSVSKDMNAHWTSKPAQNPGPGTTVQAQLWYRDPVNTSNQTTSLSDAVEFTVGN